MKKILSLILAMIIVMSLSTVAFATETNGTGNYSQDVTGSYVAGSTASGTIFSVDIDWTGMSFTYHAEKAPVWDPENHQYSETAAAYWEGEGTITVTNHSNAKITATPSYTANAGYTDAIMNFSTSKLNIASAEVGSAQSGTITVTPSGSLPKMDAAATIGSITVIIAHDTDVTVEEARKLLSDVDALESAIRKEYGYDDAYDTMFENLTSGSTGVLTYIECLDAGMEGAQEDLNEWYARLLGYYQEYKAELGL